MRTTPWIRNIPETWANSKGWRTDIALSTLSSSTYDPAEFHLEDGTRIKIPMEEMRRVLRTANIRQNRMVGPFNVNPHDGTVNGNTVEMEIHEPDGPVRIVSPTVREISVKPHTESRAANQSAPSYPTDDRKRDSDTRRFTLHKEFIKAGGAAVVGATVTVAGTSVFGGMGLSVVGTAVAIGAAPVALAGAVVGLAGYGVYRAIKG
jgi:hypothetical protein